jgi:uncharacterized protein (UPF0335 family)
MAKKPAEAKADGGNGPTPEQVNQVVKAIETEKEKLVAERMEYMRRCKPIHEEVNEIIDDAAASMGFNKKALRKKIKQREHLAKARKVEDDIDDAAEARQFQYLSESLGELKGTPLGDAAMAGFSKAARDPLADLARGAGG